MTAHVFPRLSWAQAWAAYVAAAGEGGATAVAHLAAGEAPASLADVARVCTEADARALADHDRREAGRSDWTPSPVSCGERTPRGVRYVSTRWTTVEIVPDGGGLWAVVVALAPGYGRACDHARTHAARATLRAAALDARIVALRAKYAARDAANVARALDTTLTPVGLWRPA